MRKLTPANQRSQTPSQRVKPDHEDGQSGPAFGAPAYGLQRLGDDQVAVDGDGQEVYHGGDAEEGAAEGVHLTACRGETHANKSTAGATTTARYCAI